jgi:predicted dehydrogenase
MCGQKPKGVYHMYKIGIIGSDNSHALAFAKLCNIDKYIDMRVVAIYGHDPARTAEVAKEGAIDRIVEKAEDMIGTVDTVMIVFRHGGLHAKYAYPFIERGIPVWVDKPFTVDVKEAEALVKAAAEKNVPITGGSTMRYEKNINELAEILASDTSVGPIKSAYLNFPGDINSEYAGIHFYAPHIVEMMLTLFGNQVESVVSQVIRGDLITVAKYPTFHVVLNFVNTWQRHDVIIYGGSKTLARTLDTSGLYEKALDDLLKMLQTKTPPYLPEGLIYPVKVVNAIDRSVKEQREIFLED